MTQEFIDNVMKQIAEFGQTCTEKGEYISWPLGAIYKSAARRVDELYFKIRETLQSGGEIN